MSKEISTTPCMWSGTIYYCELWWYTGLEAQIFFKSSWHFLKMNRLKFSFNGLSKSHIIEHTILPLVTKSLSKFHDTWFLTSIMWDSPMRFIFSWMSKRSINDKKQRSSKSVGYRGLMVMALDSRAKGPGFKSHPQILFLGNICKRRWRNRETKCF